MAREIALQLPTAQAMIRTWSVDNCIARSGPCWGPAHWTIFVCGLGDCARAAFGDQGLRPWIRKPNAPASEWRPNTYMC